MRSAFRIMALVLAVLAAPSTAQAALTSVVRVQPDGSGARIVATLSTDKPLRASQRPTSVSVSSKGKSYPLSKVKGTTKGGAPGTWQSAVLKGKKLTAANALVGKKVSVGIKSPGGTKTLKSVAQGPAPAPGGGTVPGPAAGTTPAAPITPVPGGSAPTSLFGNPPAPLEGQAALTAIQPFFIGSTFTDCPAGWPNCAVEQRYSFHPDGSHYYCRLTSTSGADINAVGSELTFTGASQATDGSWAISYAIRSYGNIVYYRWDVSPQGIVNGSYWGPGADPATMAPTSTAGPLQWVSGAKTCAY